jgi:alanine dehydrogenase
MLRERREHERRVLLLPREAAALVRAGLTLLVEHDAGVGVGHSDADYEAVGARIVDVEAAWAAPVTLKYKAPIESEYRWFRERMTLGAWLHAEGNARLTMALADARTTAYSFELFRTDDGYFPLSAASSEIAGKMGVIYASYFLQSQFGGSGVLLPGALGAAPAHVVVIGYGHAGGAAARLAAAMGARVTVFGTHPERLREFAVAAPSIRCITFTPEALADEVATADVVIGALRISTFDTPAMLTEHVVRSMRPGSVIVDVTCGYGPGYLPTFDRRTTRDDPIYERFGVLHCQFDALPSTVHLTTNEAVSRLVAPYLIAFLDDVYDQRPDPTSQRGCVVRDGEVVHPEVLRHLQRNGVS